MHDWSQHYKIVYKKYYDFMLANGADKRVVHEKAMRTFLGVSDGKGGAWKKGQWPSAPDLAAIAKKLGFSYRWLVTGKGDPFGDDASAPMAETPEVVPDPEMAQRNAELEAELRAREKELLDARAEIIALQRKMLGQ